MRSVLFIVAMIGLVGCAQAQVLGGGTLFANAVAFDQSWLSGCPSGGFTLSNQVAYEPTAALDPCGAPDPSASVTGTVESDVWFYFYAHTTTASIIVNPRSAFDVAIQAFSGTTCADLTEIGIVDANGNNQIETLNLSGLTINTKYYFRIFGATNSGSNRTGTYDFCGASSLATTPLPVVFTAFSCTKHFNGIQLNWTCSQQNEANYFELERSSSNSSWEKIAQLPVQYSTGNLMHYQVMDRGFEEEDSLFYYRVKQVDFDGSVVYSPIIHCLLMQQEIGDSFSVYPNPVIDGAINLVFSNVASSSYLIKIMDMNQNEIFKEDINLIGNGMVPIKTISRPGIYLIKIISAQGIMVKKVVFN
jgi:hypothetical protein